jgi:hypothetical protein
MDDNATYRELGLPGGFDTFLAVIRQIFTGGIPHHWYLRDGELLEFLEHVGFRCGTCP